MKSPISAAFATVPGPGFEPSDQARKSTATATSSFATPNESGVWFAIP